MPAKLTISSKTYSSWSLRGYLMCRIAGLDFEEAAAPLDDPGVRAELLHLAPSFLVPSLEIDGIRVWDVIAIAEYLHESAPEAGLYPADRAARAVCRSIVGEVHGGFYNLRSALPMNLRARHEGFRVFPGAQPDIDRVLEIWRERLDADGGPFLFGPAANAADAMMAPIAGRFRTYGVSLEPWAAAYRDAIFAWEPMRDWTAAAELEEDAIDELEDLDVEF
ncbi:MAG: glutathione S-transferase C-terminal domain-containing protein [Pseudomonadota bacterium]